jgi:uncharacterized protein with ATP-grasp and redox domains
LPGQRVLLSFSPNEEKHSIFFLLKAKCHVIADDIGVEEGDIMVKGANI